MRAFIRPGVGVLAVALTFAAAPTQAVQQPSSAQAAEIQGADQQPKPAPRQRTPAPAPRPEGEQQRQREAEGRPVNIQVELTITDQVESEPAQKKTVSLIVADRAFGRVRASGQAPAGGGMPGFVMVQLNVDARPAILANETIRLEITLEYRPLAPTQTTEPSRLATLNESLAVILQPGKPLTVSRAVDPFTNRRTSVDVTATIMK